VTAKSIIEIDVRDQAFKDFQSLFSRYQTQVESMPDAWGKVDRAIKSTQNPFKQISAVVGGLKKNLKDAQTTQEKFKIAAQGTGKVFGIMAGNTKKLAVNIGSVTKNLLRWASLTSVFSGLLGAGGLFGMNRLAESVSNSRRESQGLGISTGEHEAAKINYQKFVDVDSMLSKINEAKYDVTKRSAFAASGMNAGDWEKQNATQILGKLLPQIKTRFEQVGGTKQGADAMGLTQFVSMEDLTRLKSVTQEQIAAAKASADSDTKTMQISEKTQTAWQEFNTQLTRSGKTIEISLINGLVGLVEPLTRLSAAFGKAVQVFLSSPKIGKWIDQLGGAITRFASYLTSSEFTEDIKSFLDAIDTFAGSLWDVAKTIGKIFNSGNEKTLKASEYRKLDELEKLDPNVAKTVKESMVLNKSDFDDNESKRMVTKGLRTASDVHKGELNAALAGKNGARIKELIDSLHSNTEATNKATQSAPSAAPAIKATSGVAPPKALTYPSGKFSEIEKANGLQPGLLQAVENTESNGGKNKNDSRVGAQGPFQFMPKTWAQYGKGGDVHNEMDAAKAAGELLSRLSKKYKGDMPKMLAGYNWGEGNVDRKGMEKAPKETRDYIAKTAADRQSQQDKRESSQNTVASASPTPRTVMQTAPINVSINKAAGADVFTTVNGMSYGS
jgi:membrane-bound lytic murein transglycosylase B